MATKAPPKKPALKAQAPQRPAAPPPRPQQQAKVPVVQQPRTVAVSDQFEDFSEQYAGQGVSTRARDNIIPGIKLLQPLSPEVVQRLEQGAEGGSILVKGLGVISAEDGIWVQPCGMREEWREFVPRENGGGFVASYPMEYDDHDQPIPPPGAEQDPEDKFHYSFTESGNNCIHYRTVPVILWRRETPESEPVGLEYVMNFTGTGHSVAKAWNTSWGRKRSKKTGRPMGSFTHLYRATTYQKTNAQGTWYLFQFSVGMPLDQATDIVGEDWQQAMQIGAGLAQAYASGEKVGEVEQPDEGLATSDDKVPY
jgi:hypothetical protein